MKLLLAFIAMSSVFSCSVGKPITSREKGRGKLREDRLEYATTENRLIYASKYLKDFGYMDEDVRTRSLSDKKLGQLLERPLKKYQRQNDLEVTGELDEATIAQFLEGRCAIKDTDTDEDENSQADADKDGNQRRSRQKRSAALTNKWGKKDLTYTVKDVPRKFNDEKVLKIVKDAAKQWQDSSGLTLSYVKPWQKADIKLNFDKIDNKMNVLGLGHYPPIGDITFDLAENWNFDDITSKRAKGPNFRNVALHEFGHALGIRHSRKKNNIMHPRYSRSTLGTLTDSDISSIQRLFGRPPRSQGSAKVSSRSSTNGRDKTSRKTKKLKNNNSKTTKRPRTGNRNKPKRTPNPTEVTKSKQKNNARRNARNRNASRRRKAPKNPSLVQTVLSVLGNNRRNINVVGGGNGMGQLANALLSQAAVQNSGTVVVSNGQVVTNKQEQTAALQTLFNNNPVNNAIVTDIGSLTTDVPSSTTGVPSSTTDVPSSTTDVPSSTTGVPSSATDAPSSTTDAPSSTTDAPSSTTEADSSTTEATGSTTDAEHSTTVVTDSTTGADRSTTGSTGPTTDADSSTTGSTGSTTDAENTITSKSVGLRKQFSNNPALIRSAGNSDAAADADFQSSTTDADSSTTISTVFSTTDADGSSTSMQSSATDSIVFTTDSVTPPVMPSNQASPNSNTLAAPTTFDFEETQEAVIPRTAQLAIHYVNAPDLARVTNTTSWNGQMAWYPDRLINNRFLVMGLKDGIEIVDTAPGSIQGIAEAQVWWSRTIIQDKASQVLPNGPGRMVMSSDVLYIVDRARHCLLTLAHSDFAVLAGVCGKSGYKDGARIAAEFNSPVDVCVQSSGIVYVLDQGNSKLRTLQQYGAEVSTLVNLPSDVKFEAMDCTGFTIYLSANDEHNSYIYAINRVYGQPATLQKLVSLRRGAGHSGSLLAGEATARGLFTDIVTISRHILINDGGSIRDLHQDRGYIYTLCHRHQVTEGGLPGNCSISHLDSLNRIEGSLFGLDVTQNKLLTFR